MFQRAITFNGDISKCDVSSVTHMSIIFLSESAINGDVSKWDVSRVRNMDYMFQNVKSFKQELCGAAWVHSKASKIQMFAGSPGSISRIVYTTSPAFSPGSEEELKSAVDERLKLSPKGDCSSGPHGAIGE